MVQASICSHIYAHNININTSSNTRETSVHKELSAKTTPKTAESDNMTNGSLQEIHELEDVSIIDVDAPFTNCLHPVDHGKSPDISSPTIPWRLYLMTS
ncbi:hypothetical protein V6N13_133763 [Hibiscus sabdariffa]